jgi:thiosulfate reductase cytochrome b subunit
MALDEKQIDKDLQDLKVQVALLNEKMSVLTKTLEISIAEMKANYVTKSEFNPIQKVVYGLVSTILITVIAGIMALLIKN